MPAWVLPGGAAIAWGVLAAALWPQHRLLPAAGLVLGLWVAACIDLRVHRIPNAVVLAILVVGVLSQLLQAGLAPALACLSAACASGGLFAALAALTRGGFGWGDVKLAAAMGWVLGPTATAAALAATAVAGGLVAAALLLVRHRGLRDPLPFAPFFFVGGLVGLAVLIVR